MRYQMTNRCVYLSIAIACLLLILLCGCIVWATIALAPSAGGVGSFPTPTSVVPTPHPMKGKLPTVVLYRAKKR